MAWPDFDFKKILLLIVGWWGFRKGGRGGGGWQGGPKEYPLFMEREIVLWTKPSDQGPPISFIFNTPGPQGGVHPSFSLNLEIRKLCSLV